MNSGSSLIAAGTFTGIITYNRTLIDDWHLIASPVVGETIENMYLKNNFIEANTIIKPALIILQKIIHGIFIKTLLLVL